jgi:hypothetical protein
MHRFRCLTSSSQLSNLSFSSQAGSKRDVGNNWKTSRSLACRFPRTQQRAETTNAGWTAGGRPASANNWPGNLQEASSMMSKDTDTDTQTRIQTHTREIVAETPGRSSTPTLSTPHPTTPLTTPHTTQTHRHTDTESHRPPSPQTTELLCVCPVQ